METIHSVFLHNFNPRSPHGERQERPMIQAMVVAHFNPRSPHGERLFPISAAYGAQLISIHAPRTGSDTNGICGIVYDAQFQSTLPARGATTLLENAKKELAKFQSTLPARGATLPVIIAKTPVVFQSTLPARGATARASDCVRP